MADEAITKTNPSPPVKILGLFALGPPLWGYKGI